jgi:4-amino-4-deoxy-L-arabinose transferase-like glycosyltransferase
VTSRIARPTVTAGYVALVLAFGLAGALRAWPFDDDVRPVPMPADDWRVYKYYAINIVEQGWTIPAVAGPYVRPAGFLYNYFVAAVFGVFGPNSTVVYVAHALLLAATVVFVHAAVRRSLSTLERWALIAALATYGAVDVFHVYSFRLLSENLAYPLLAGGFYFAVTGQERRRLGRAIAAGALMAGAVLARPNAGLVPIVLGALWYLYARKREERAWLRPLAFLAAAGACLLVLPLRNLAAAGAASPLSVLASRPEAADPQVAQPGSPASWPDLASIAWTYARRTLFVLGFMSLYDDEFRNRLHWLPMWGGFMLTVVRAAWQRRPLLFWEAACLGIVVAYVGPLIYLSALSSYGFRMLIPALPFVLALSVRCVPALLVFLGRITGWPVVASSPARRPTR